MKDKYQRFKYTIDKMPGGEAKVVISLNSENKLGIKIVDRNTQEIDTSLYEVEGYYDGVNKPKPMYTLPVSNDQFSYDVNKELVNYDAIIAIDTSFEVVGPAKQAFTCIMILNKLNSDAESYQYQRTCQNKP